MAASDLASLLAAGERAVFHGPPAAAVPDLEQAVAVAQAEGRQAELAAANWLLGVTLAAAGRYGSALRTLLPLLAVGEADGAAAEVQLFAALAAATAASVHRGLGRPDAAQRLDARGLLLSDGAGEAGFDCRLGLACDAVGRSSLPDARASFAEAEDIASDHGDDWWRQRVRLHWARAEIALLAGDPPEATRSAAASVQRAERAHAPRHVAKGLLFQGTAELRAGSPDAAATLRRAATLAEQLGALPLVWQAGVLLGSLLVSEAPEESERSLAAARAAATSIANDLPRELREPWLARPDVQELLKQ